MTIFEDNNKIFEHKKKMVTKVRFVGVGHKCPNTKIYGQTFDHSRIRVPLVMGYFLNIMGVHL